MELTKLFDEFVNEQSVMRNARQATLDGYTAAFTLFHRFFGAASLSDLNESMLRNFFLDLNHRSRKFKGKDLRPSTIGTYRSKLNTFLEWLRSNGHIAKNPMRAIPKPRIEYVDKRYIDGKDVEKIFNTLGFIADWTNPLIKARNIAIFSTFFYTGIRRSELIHLRISDVDLRQRSLFINGETSKSRRNRTVPMHPQLVNALEAYLKCYKEAHYEGTSLFASSVMRGRGLTLNGLKHLVDKVRKESGIQFHVHQFRHTFAVNLLNNGTDIGKLRQLMGHKDITMTAQYLREIPQKALKDDVDALSFHNML